MATKAYSYIRFSSAAQAQGDSLNRQLSATRKYAADNDLDLDESLRDLGVSAFKGKNATVGDLGKFLALVQAGKVPVGSVLIVESLDRLSRQTVLKALTQFISIITAGVEIVTLADSQRYNLERIEKDQMSLMMSILVMSRAYEESAIKSKRVRAANVRARANAAMGVPMTAWAPFWLTLPKVSEVGRGTPRKFTIIPEQAALVRRVFKMSTDLGLGYQRIVNRLNTEGIPAPRSKLGWHPSSIQRLLQNDAVIGIFRPWEVSGSKRLEKGEQIDDYYPAILNRETYYRAQAALRSRGAGRPRGRRAPAGQNLFHGLLKCGGCGRSMLWVQKKDTEIYYQCRAARYGQGCDHKTLHRVDEFQSMMFDHIHEFEFEQENSEVKQMLGRITAFNAQFEELKTKRARLIKLAEDGDDEAVSDRIHDLSKQIKAAEADRDKLTKEYKSISAAPDRSERVVSAKALIARMSKLTGDALVDARAKLATDLRELIEVVEFNSKQVVVILRGERYCYAFRDGKLVSAVPSKHVPRRLAA